MGIGTSKGAFYEDQFHYAQSQWDPKYDDNEISPNKMQTDKKLDKSELDPSTGLGIEVGYKGQTGNPGFFNKLIYGDNPALPEISLGGPKGSADPKDISKEDLEKATNIGLSAGPGTMVGLQSLNSLVAAERGTLLSKLGHAQVLDQGGVHGDDIFTTTGFYKGADGKWRYEIGDKDATYKGFPEPQARGPMDQQPLFDSAKLGDILDHPELYKHYPHFKDMDVIHDPELSGAHFDTSNNSITLGGKPYRNLLGEEVTAINDKSTLMHEIQHAVQNEEGFAQGGVPARAGNTLHTNPTTYKLKYEDDYKNWRSLADLEMDRIMDKFEKAGNDRSVLTKKEVDFSQRYQKIRDTYQQYKREGDIKASDNYFKLAGETEARNVQNRLDLDELTRSNTPPRWTQDIPNEQQIVRDEPTMTTPYGALTSREINELRKR